MGRESAVWVAVVREAGNLSGPDGWLRGAEAVIQEGGMGQAGVKFQKLVDKRYDASGKLGWSWDQV